jgi:hypothetical protein
MVRRKALTARVPYTSKMRTWWSVSFLVDADELDMIDLEAVGGGIIECVEV